MHIDALDSYRAAESPLHRLDPRVKLVLTGLLILAVALTPERAWVTFALLQGLLLLAELLSRVGLGLVHKRSLVALPFALAALTMAFSTPGRPLWTLGPWAVTDAGLLRFFAVIVRSYVSIQAAVLLAATTAFPDLLWGMRALRVPRTLVAIGGFLYRYLFVLADEVQRLMRAREARSAAPDERGGGGLAWRARVTGGMAGSLFIRSTERSERIYAAMLARGYDGEVRTLAPPALRPVDWVVGAVGAMMLGAVIVVTRVV